MGAGRERQQGAPGRRFVLWLLWGSAIPAVPRWLSQRFVISFPPAPERWSRQAGSSWGLDYLGQFRALTKLWKEQEGSSTMARGRMKGPCRKAPLPPSFPSLHLGPLRASLPLDPRRRRGCEPPAPRFPVLQVLQGSSPGSTGGHSLGGRKLLGVRDATHFQKF